MGTHALAARHTQEIKKKKIEEKFRARQGKEKTAPNCLEGKKSPGRTLKTPGKVVSGRFSILPSVSGSMFTQEFWFEVVVPYRVNPLVR